MIRRSWKSNSLIAASVLMMSGCSESKVGKTDRNNNVQCEGTKKMTRTKTTTGLEYEIIKEGTGAQPQKRQQVTVHYTGWLAKNGEPDLNAKFDSSVDRGQPFTFVIGAGQVIRGWDEGVMTMKPGEKRRLILPPDLAYGASGAGRAIPPHATLVFDVELLKVS